METTIQLGPSQKQLELFGPGDSYLRIIRQSLDVKITARQDKVTITGRENNVNKAADVIHKMQQQLLKHHSVMPEDISTFIIQEESGITEESSDIISVYSHKKAVKPTTKGQHRRPARRCDPSD